jgi:hypothetical protein
MKVFSPEWGSLIHSFVSGGSVAINVSDDIGKYLQTKKGLRQENPLLLMLFNIVTNMFAIVIERAKSDGKCLGVMSHLVDCGLSILQYVFFSKWEYPSLCIN